MSACRLSADGFIFVLCFERFFDFLLDDRKLVTWENVVHENCSIDIIECFIL